jgi:D-sedoheptulose 7-phosphate isomerase
MASTLERALTAHLEAAGALANLAREMDALAALANATLRAGGKLLLLGNGGSAALCQHIATELVARFRRDRPALAAIALTTDAVLLTAVANDLAFDLIFSRQVEALAQPGDLVLGASTSRESENVVRGIQAARTRGCATAALLGGDGGRLRCLVDIAVVVPSREVDRVQECHLFLGHYLCDEIERAFADAN